MTARQEDATSINLDDLIERLEELREEVGGESEVRLAHQPRWAFEYSIDENAIAAAKVPAEEYRRKRSEVVVYIGEGSQVGYLPHKAAVAIGWSEARDDEEDDDDDE